MAKKKCKIRDEDGKDLLVGKHYNQRWFSVECPYCGCFNSFNVDNVRNPWGPQFIECDFGVRGVGKTMGCRKHYAVELERKTTHAIKDIYKLEKT